MSWIRYAAAVPFVICMCGCNSHQATGQGGKPTEKAPKAVFPLPSGGSVITGNSGSFYIDLTSSGTTNFDWSCDQTNDCSTDTPLGSTFTIWVKGVNHASFNMRGNWKIAVSPHNADLQNRGGRVHAHANGAGDFWRLSGKTITHSKTGPDILRVDVTDDGGTHSYDAVALCNRVTKNCIRFEVR